jgi:uncharacterized protein (TIGR02646 family)|tara:strand:- start:213 stop:887 length:675 start_codon:yes stop_codon:yes gene_type:complete
MKKLNRGISIEPTCLQNLCHTTHKWKNVTKNKKKAIWRELNKFQDEKCVYCESNAHRGEQTGHIEHFFDKSNFEHLTFDWNNLFGCCVSKVHCGHYKDQLLPSGIRRPYDHNLLIKPDQVDPEEYFQFLPNGEVIEKRGISEHMSEKAKETIRALYLNAPSLKQSREAQIKRFEDRVTAAFHFLVSDDEYIKNSAMIEYNEIKQDAAIAEYRTAIKQAVSWLNN